MQHVETEEIHKRRDFNTGLFVPLLYTKVPKEQTKKQQNHNKKFDNLESLNIKISVFSKISYLLRNNGKGCSSVVERLIDNQG